MWHIPLGTPCIYAGIKNAVLAICQSIQGDPQLSFTSIWTYAFVIVYLPVVMSFNSDPFFIWSVEMYESVYNCTWIVWPFSELTLYYAVIFRNHLKPSGQLAYIYTTVCNSKTAAFIHPHTSQSKYQLFLYTAFTNLCL